MDRKEIKGICVKCGNTAALFPREEGEEPTVCGACGLFEDDGKPPVRQQTTVEK